MRGRDIKAGMMIEDIDGGRHLVLKVESTSMPHWPVVVTWLHEGKTIRDTRYPDVDYFFSVASTS